MNQLSQPVYALLAAAGTASALLLGMAPAQAHGNDACPTLGLSKAAEQRVLAKVAQGPGALRQYLEITEPIYQLDMFDVEAWATARRPGSCS